MNGYALVIDIFSDEENARTSTPIKTLPLNMVGSLNLSDSSTEVYRGSDAEINSTFESEFRRRRSSFRPKRKKVSFNRLHPLTNGKAISMKSRTHPRSLSH